MAITDWKDATGQNLPAALPYFRLTGQVAIPTADSPDPGLNPDVIEPIGSVILSPKLNETRFPGTKDADPLTIALVDIPIKINHAGQLYVIDAEAGARILNTADPRLNPSCIPYTVRFEFEEVDDIVKPRIAPFDILPPPPREDGEPWILDITQLAEIAANGQIVSVEMARALVAAAWSFAKEATAAAEFAEAKVIESADNAAEARAAAEMSEAKAIEAANSAEQSREQATASAESAKEAQKQATASAASAVEAKNQATESAKQAAEAKTQAGESAKTSAAAQAAAEAAQAKAVESANSAAQSKQQAETATAAVKHSESLVEASAASAKQSEAHAVESANSAAQSKQQAETATAAVKHSESLVEASAASAVEAKNQATESAKQAAEAKTQAGESAKTSAAAQAAAEAAQAKAVESANSAAQSKQQAETATAAVKHSESLVEASAASAKQSEAHAAEAEASAEMSEAKAVEAADSAEQSREQATVSAASAATAAAQASEAKTQAVEAKNQAAASAKTSAAAQAAAEASQAKAVEAADSAEQSRQRSEESKAAVVKVEGYAADIKKALESGLIEVETDDENHRIRIRAKGADTWSEWTALPRGQRGEKGERGEQGERGERGEPGAKGSLDEEQLHTEMFNFFSSKLTKIAGTGGSFIAQNKRGESVVFGQNEFGQIDPRRSDIAGFNNTIIYKPISCYCPEAFTQVSVGYSHSIAIDPQGRLWQWGRPMSPTEPTRYYTQIEVEGDHKFTQVSAGFTRSVALDDQGYPWTWGASSQPDLGLEKLSSTDRPMRVYNPNQLDVKLVAISTGLSHTLALDKNGVCWAWGENQSNQLGKSNGFASSGLVEVANSGITYTQVFAGYGTSFALDRSGQIWAWGANFNGGLGTGTSEDRIIVPTKVAQGHKFAKIIGEQCAVDEDGKAWIWGFAAFMGSEITPSKEEYARPRRIVGKENATPIYYSKGYLLEVDSDGLLWMTYTGHISEYSMNSERHWEKPVPTAMMSLSVEKKKREPSQFPKIERLTDSIPFTLAEKDWHGDADANTILGFSKVAVDILEGWTPVFAILNSTYARQNDNWSVGQYFMKTATISDGDSTVQVEFSKLTAAPYMLPTEGGGTITIYGYKNT
ncbi:hypothetical protein HHJ75_00550 [Mobiluncus mulieris]|uniref:hypothetical protein n=1 Tax=Mobiluncus mulieris TaxID=2052 RepID=UPI00146FFB30|nr:hypothetical protein [Mobiluncus mulieris]NMX00233.1 hypothetical protein [Mobiluncus mulieris]